MAATLKDICKATGLSSATVSRVINKSPLVKEDTRKQVEKAMADLDYYPSPAARALAGSKTHLVGVVSPYIGTGFFTQVLLGIDNVAADSGYHMVTAFGRHKTGDEHELVRRFLRERRSDVLVVVNVSLDEDFLEEIKDTSTPIVVIDAPLEGHNIPSVTIDNRVGMKAMMEHVLDVGCRDIYILTGPEDSYDSRERLMGCLDVLGERGVKVPGGNVLGGDFIQETGLQLMEHVMEGRDNPPDAVVCLNDTMAIGVMEYCKDKGISIPGDMLLSGFDDSDMAKFVGLTTVKFSAMDMGETATKMALQALEDGKPGKDVVVPVNLVVRESTTK